MDWGSAVSYKQDFYSQRERDRICWDFAFQRRVHAGSLRLEASPGTLRRRFLVVRRLEENGTEGLESMFCLVAKRSVGGGGEVCLLSLGNPTLVFFAFGPGAEGYRVESPFRTG